MVGKSLVFLFAFLQLHSRTSVGPQSTLTFGYPKLRLAYEVATTDIITILGSGDDLLSAGGEPSEKKESTEEHESEWLHDSRVLWQKHNESQRASGSSPKTGKGATIHLMMSFAMFYGSLLVLLLISICGSGGVVAPFWYTLTLVSFGSSLVGFFLYGLLQV